MVIDSVKASYNEEIMCMINNRGLMLMGCKMELKRDVVVGVVSFRGFKGINLFENS